MDVKRKVYERTLYTRDSFLFTVYCLHITCSSFLLTPYSLQLPPHSSLFPPHSSLLTLLPTLHCFLLRRSSRPFRKLQVNALPSWIELFGSATMADNVFAMSPVA